MKFLDLCLHFVFTFDVRVLLVVEVVLQFLIGLVDQFEVVLFDVQLVFTDLQVALDLVVVLGLLLEFILELEDLVVTLDHQVLFETAVADGYFEVVQLGGLRDQQVVGTHCVEDHVLLGLVHVQLVPLLIHGHAARRTLEVVLDHQGHISQFVLQPVDLGLLHDVEVLAAPLLAHRLFVLQVRSGLLRLVVLVRSLFLFCLAY